MLLRLDGPTSGTGGDPFRYGVPLNISKDFAWVFPTRQGQLVNFAMIGLPFLQTLGTFDLVMPSHQPPKSTKGLALLALLVVHKRPIHRREVVSLLWGDTTERKGRSSLKQAIYTLRQSLGHDVIVAENDRISVSADHLSSDYDAFVTAIEHKAYDRAIELYGGPFLAGHPYISDEFDDWRLAVSSRLEIDALMACEHQLSWAINAGSPSDVSRIAALGLSIDPLNIPFTKARVIALASQGEAAAANRELERARVRFKEETGDVPADIARALDSQLSGDSLSVHPRFEKRSLPIVGRDLELARIRTQWERAKNAFAIVVVHGEPGIGKSRVFQQTLRRVAIDGGRLFVYSCAEVESALPYSAAAGLLRDGRRHLANIQLSAEDRAVIASLVPELFPGVPGVSHVSRLRVFEAVAKVWQEVAAEGPVAIAVDDYQWIDQGSLELLAYVQKRLSESPILLLTAGRGDFSPVLYEDELDKSIVCTLPLLSDEDCESLMSNYEAHHGCTVDRSTRDLVKRKVGGRPLLLVEVLHSLRMADGDTALDRPTIVSPTLNASIARRLKGISESAQLMTAAAAVLNREISLFELARIANLDADVAACAADELIASSMIGDGRTIRFSHDLLRDIVFDGMSHPQRVRWHYRIAQHLVASQSSRYAEIAYHYEEAGDKHAAFEFAKLSVEEAERFFAYKDIDEAYARMLRCASAAQRESVSIQLFRHWVSLGRLREAFNLIESAAVAFKSRNDKEGLLLCEIVQYAVRLSESADGNGRVDSARGIIRLAEAHNPERLSTVLWQLADPIRSSGDYTLLREFTACLVEYSKERSQDSRIFADLSAAAALVGLMSYGFEFAKPLAESAVRAASITSNSGLLARALYARGTVAVCSGDLDRAMSDYEEIVRKWSDVLPDDVVTRIKSNYSIVLMEQGAYDEASIYARMALREAGIARRSYAFGNLALIGLRKGDLDSATRYATALLESHAATGLAWVLPHGEAILGLIKLADGAVAEAAEHARRAECGLAAAEGIIDCSPIYELCGRVAVQTGQLSKAIQILEAGIAHLGHMDRLATERLLAVKATAVMSMTAQDGQASDAPTGKT